MTKMTTTRLAPSKCIHCGTVNDAATSVSGDHVPTPGDVTICLWCGTIMAFDDDLKMRELTKEEAISVAGDKRILRAQWARGKIGLQRQPKGT